MEELGDKQNIDDILATLGELEMMGMQMVSGDYLLLGCLLFFFFWFTLGKQRSNRKRSTTWRRMTILTLWRVAPGPPCPTSSRCSNWVFFFVLVPKGIKLDLKHIALHARNAEYNSKRFAAVIMRIRDPKTTAFIFQNGKVVVTGKQKIVMFFEDFSFFYFFIFRVHFDDCLVLLRGE